MLLITSGCSFSLTAVEHNAFKNGWPNFLAEKLNANLISKAKGAAGNDFISRSIIYEVSKNLDKKDDLLVGVMWSGTDRHEIYDPDTIWPLHGPFGPENPVGFIENSKVWQLMNSHWDEHPKASVYYEKIHHKMYGYIKTLEHILRTQWFLEKHNIKYFMSTYMDLFKTMPRTEDVMHLWDLIDWDKFLPVTGAYEWCKENYPAGFPLKNDPHPGPRQWKCFTEEVINEYLHR